VENLQAGSQPLFVSIVPSLGDVVVNLAEQTVSFGGFVAPINTADAANVTFGGTPIGTLAQIASKEGDEIYINGTLDRVTGHMEVSTSTGPKGTQAMSAPPSTICDAPSGQAGLLIAD
jgi:hypothetical protein